MAIVADIVAQLKRGGPLRNPFERGYPATPPADYVAGEVQCSIDRIRARRDGEWLSAIPADKVPKRSASDYRKLGRLLRKTGHAEYAEQIGASDHVQQEPPPRADALKHYCADEGFCLMEWFSAKPATLTEDGAYQIVVQTVPDAIAESPS